MQGCKGNFASILAYQYQLIHQLSRQNLNNYHCIVMDGNESPETEQLDKTVSQVSSQDALYSCPGSAEDNHREQLCPP